MESPSVNASLEAWLNYLNRPQGPAIQLGLERVCAVGAHVKRDQLAQQIITVAGTNGKGTTCCTVEQILLAEGLRVGVYSSPHLLHYTERVRVNGLPVNEPTLCKAFAEIEHHRGQTALTCFEHSTMAAFSIFQRSQLDVLILEVGLGGRHDAVNCVDPDVAVVTNVGIDHVAFLGNTREAIGYQKAGIFRAHKPAIIGELDPPQSVLREIHSLKAQRWQRGMEWDFSKTDQMTWRWEGVGHPALEELPYPHIPLINAATALTALMALNRKLSIESIRTGLSQSRLAGRFQTVSECPRAIVDVAHNPHGTTWLSKQIREVGLDETGLHCVVGMLADKDIANSIAPLLPLTKKWYYAPLEDTVRGHGSVALLQAALPQDASYFLTMETAWEAALNTALPTETVIAFGSFHTVGRILKAINQKACQDAG